jgi:hypothetical protein
MGFLALNYGVKGQISVPWLFSDYLELVILRESQGYKVNASYSLFGSRNLYNFL